MSEVKTKVCTKCGLNRYKVISNDGYKGAKEILIFASSINTAIIIANNYYSDSTLNKEGNKFKSIVKKNIDVCSVYIKSFLGTKEQRKSKIKKRDNASNHKKKKIAEWKKKNSERIRQLGIKHSKVVTKELRKSYVIYTLIKISKTNGFKIKSKDIPKSLINLKRIQLKIFRELKRG